ncbi:MAG: SIMPL domain-containing protein [Actinomycetota bacterium]
MRRVLVLVAASALTLAACGSGDGVLGTGDGSSTGSGINVTGQGTVTGTPDTLTLTLGVSVLRSTVDQATADAATKAAAIIAALKTKGVAEEDIQTANYSIYPEYDYSGNTQHLTGYRVQNDLKVKIRHLDGAGAVIDAATAAGGNDAVVSGLAFSIEDNSELLQVARTAAWNDAEAKAEQLAQLAGVTLGKAFSITETIQYQTPPIYYERAAADSAGETTPIEAGQQDVIVTVQVVFSIG